MEQEHILSLGDIIDSIDRQTEMDEYELPEIDVDDLEDGPLY